MVHIELMAPKRSVIRQVMTNLSFSEAERWFYRDHDQQRLEQAALVAHQNRIDLPEIERCSEGEGKADLFKQIREQLESKAQ